MLLPHEISIRPVRTDRDASLFSMYVSSHFDGYNPEHRLQWLSRKFLPRLLDGSALGLAVYQDNRTVVGGSFMYPYPSENKAEVKYFSVGDLQRGYGIGSMLWILSEFAITRALNLAPGQTCKLTLDTRETNVQAMHFFKSHGCQEVRRDELYERGILDVLYEKTVCAPLSYPGR